MQLKTAFVITVLTWRMVMPGMPSLPAGLGAPGIGSPTRTLTLDLTSGKTVDAQSKAECAVPEGMRLGPKVDLQIDLPTTEKPAPVTGDTPDKGKVEKPKFVIKSYWDCGEVVPPGQPKIMDSEKLMGALPGGGVDFRQTMRAAAKRSAAPAEGSRAYWPGRKAKPIKDDAGTPGMWELTTNYCGGTSIAFDKDQDFLAPIEITNPTKGDIDLEQTIKVEWNSVPNAVAYCVSAFAAKEGEMVMWTSSAQPDAAADFTHKALGKEEVKDYITKGILLPATKTSCRIPAGIFKDVGAPGLTVTAIGVDKTQDRDGIKTAITVRSTATVMFGGMGMGGKPEDANAKDQPTDEAAAKTDNADAGSGDAADKANKQADKVDKAKDTLGRLGGIFKRK